MNHDRYILDGTTPVEEPDLMKWARWFEFDQHRRIAETTYLDSRISTVFLGIDHSFGAGPPLLFETMVFGGPLDMKQERYSTWDQALAGHKAMEALVLGRKAGV